MHIHFCNTGRLTQFIMKRERITSAVWIVILMLLSASIPFVLSTQFSTTEDLQFFLETMQNPAMISMMGPVYGADNYTIGIMYANEMLLLTAIAIAIMNIFLVVRNTRGDEEIGRTEVIRSLPVGRLSNLNATMLTAVAVNTALAVLCGLVMSMLGIESMDFAGSMLYGAVLGVSGIFFAAVTALFVQLCSSSRNATGYSFVFLGVCYLVRAVGDISSEVLSLISPLGLILRTQVYVENNSWPVFIVLLLSVIVAAIAYYLNSIRDMGQGFIPAKPGRKNASVMLQSSFGLSFRLLRNTFIAWIVGMFVFGAAYGSIMGDLETFIGNNEFFLKLLPSSPDYSMSELFITMLNAILSLVCSVPVFTTVLKLRNEEKDNHSEHILGRVVSRINYLMGFTVISFAACIVMPFAAVFGLWAASSPVMETPIAFGSMFKAMMVYVPALWVMLGLAVLIIGFAPKATSICWAYFGFSFFATYLGRMLNMPEWLKLITPFGHIPQLPVDEINYFRLVILVLIAGVLIAAGFIFYRKRDMQGVA